MTQKDSFTQHTLRIPKELDSEIRNFAKGKLNPAFILLLRAGLKEKTRARKGAKKDNSIDNSAN